MYSLRFWSRKVGVPTGNGKTRNMRVTGVCIYGDSQELEQGEAVCCHLDQDDKLKGQKAALTNALLKVDDRGARKDIWGAFFTHSRRAKELVR